MTVTVAVCAENRERRCVSDLIRNFRAIKNIALSFFLSQGLVVCPQAFAQNQIEYQEKRSVAFSEAPRTIRTPAPLIQEVTAPDTSGWYPPPELISPPGIVSEHTLEHRFVPSQPSSPLPAQRSFVPREYTSTNNYKPITYIPGLKPIGEVDISIAPKTKENDATVPQKVVNIDKSTQQFNQITTGHALQADFYLGSTRERVAYQPLYFEEVNLERYGRYVPGQPFLSIGRFFGTIPTLPYQMVVNDPRKPHYWNWPHQAGWGAPRVRELPPFRWNAFTIEAISITGAAALIP